VIIRLENYRLVNIRGREKRRESDWCDKKQCTGPAKNRLESCCSMPPAMEHWEKEGGLKVFQEKGK